jgi:hypothetical protein
MIVVASCVLDVIKMQVELTSALGVAAIAIVLVMRITLPY